MEKMCTEKIKKRSKAKYSEPEKCYHSSLFKWPRIQWHKATWSLVFLMLVIKGVFGMALLQNSRVEQLSFGVSRVFG
jgi:hypothetical protein